jgi:hypothetical protein
MLKPAKTRGMRSESKAARDKKDLPKPQVACPILSDDVDKPTSKKAKLKKPAKNAKSLHKADETSLDKRKATKESQAGLKLLESNNYTGFTRLFEDVRAQGGSTIAANNGLGALKLSDKAAQTLKAVQAKHSYKLPELSCFNAETAVPDEEGESWPKWETQGQKSEADERWSFDLEAKPEDSTLGSTTHELSLRSRATIAKISGVGVGSGPGQSGVEGKKSPAHQLASLPHSVSRLALALSPSLPAAFQHVRQAFVALDSALAFLALHGHPLGRAFAEVAKVALALQRHCLTLADLQAVLAVDPRLLEVSWKSDLLWLTRAGLDEKPTTPGALQSRRDSFELKLIALAKQHSVPPKAELPPKTDKKDGLKNTRDFLNSCSEGSLAESLWKKVEEERKRRENEFRPVEDENSCGNGEASYTQQSSNIFYQSSSSSDSIFKSSLIAMIKEKEARRLQKEEESRETGVKPAFDCQEILDLSTSIRLYYASRKVSNMFLVQVVERLSKNRANGRIYSPQEVGQRLDFIVESTAGWLLKVPNEAGLLLRMDQKFSVAEVTALVKQRWEAGPAKVSSD